MSISATKPPACKICEHWGKAEKEGRGMCDLASTRRWKDAASSRFDNLPIFI